MDSESELQDLKPFNTNNTIEMESIDIDSEYESDLKLLISNESNNGDFRTSKSNGPNFIIPKVSKERYETTYNSYIQWCKDHKMTSTYSENVLLMYFGEQSTKLKATTLLTQHSILRTTLNINHNVDISKYTKLRAFLKRRFVGYRPREVKFFTPEEVKKFITEAPDNQYLLAKVVLIMGVMGACRREELYKMKIHDLKDFGSGVLVKVPSTTKKPKPRKFTITGQYYEIFKKYTSLRPANAHHPWFFLNYNNEKCSCLKIGINKFGNLGKQIAKYLKVPNPELYTGNSFRKSSKTVFIDSAEDIGVLGKRGVVEDEGDIDEALTTTRILNSMENSENSDHFENEESRTFYDPSKNCNWLNMNTEKVGTEAGTSTYQNVSINSENMDISSQNDVEEDSNSRPTCCCKRKRKKSERYDEIDLFFQSIAMSVKKLSPELRSEAKIKTLQVLSEFESRNVRNSIVLKREPSPSTSCSSYS